MNTTNANQTMGFDDFAKCNYNLHWSFSNFNRMLMAASEISKLRFGATVLELGAGSSNLKNIVYDNFKRNDILFIRVDGDKRYLHDNTIDYVGDITNQADKEAISDLLCHKDIMADAVVLMEVLEHLDDLQFIGLIETIANRWLAPEGILLLTTPTPPLNGMYEDRVWPTDHESEYKLAKLKDRVGVHFKITKEIGWSLEEREFNALLEKEPHLMRTYCKLKGAFPEGYIRAIIASLADIEYNRQVFMTCKRRRRPNGRPTSTR